MIFTQEALLTRKWFSGRSCIRLNWNTGIKSFSFFCWTLCIVGQKVSTKSWMTVISLSPLPEYCYYLLGSSNIRVKGDKMKRENSPIRLPLETWCSLSIPQCAASNKGNWNSWCLYKLGVNFKEGGNQSGRRKPSKSGWDRLKLNPHTTFVVEVEGVIEVHCASLTTQGVWHRVLYLDGHPSRYQPCPTGLNFGEQTGTGVFPLVIAVPSNINALTID